MLEKTGIFCYNNSVKKEANYQELSKEELIKLLLKKDADFDKLLDKLKEGYEAKFMKLQIENNELLKEIESLKEKNILARVRQFCSKSEHNKDINEFNEAESNIQKKKMREENYLPYQIKEERNKEGYQVLLNAVKQYAENINALPESALGKARNYLLNHWKEFTTYLEDGHIEMTNNISERAIKPFVIARKNFLFNATSDGAESSAIIFSLQQTARANLLDSEKYITKVLELIKPDMSEEELDSLLPWNISKEYNLT